MAPPPDLAESVACVWTSVSRGGVILPDGCVDLVWRGDRLIVAGPATGAIESPVPVGTTVFGVRFRLGVAGAALGRARRGVRRHERGRRGRAGPGRDRPRGRGRDARAARARARAAAAGGPAGPRGRAGDGPAGDARGGAGHVARRERTPAAAAVPRRGRLRARRRSPGCSASSASSQLSRERGDARRRSARGSRSTRATPTRRTSRARRGGSPGGRRPSSSRPAPGRRANVSVPFKPSARRARTVRRDDRQSRGVHLEDRARAGAAAVRGAVQGR